MNCIDLMSKRSNQRKTTKVILFRWIWIDLTSKQSKLLSYVEKHSKLRKTTKWSNYSALHRFDVKTIKTFELGRNTTKLIKFQWIASIWHQNNQKCWDTSQNIQNYAKLRKSSNYNELHRFDVRKIKPTQNYKSDQIIMNCIDLTSKRSKLLSYVAKQQNDQIIVHCIDFTSKRSKTLMYIAKHSKQRKTTKVIKLQWIASIWCQKDQINAKLQKWSYFDEFGLIWRQNDQNVWVRSQHYKINQIPMDCIDLTSKQSKMLRYVAKHSKLRKTTKVIKLQWIASIWCQKDQTNAKLQKWYYFNELGLIWRQNDQNVWVRSQNNKSNQITMDCIDLTSKQSKMLRYVAKHSKLRKTTKVIKLQWIASIWCQKDQTNAKLQKWYYFDEFGSIWHQNNQNCWVTSKNIQNYAKLQNDQIIVHCIDLASKRSKTLRYVAKLQKWSNYNELHRFDIKTN